jgi:collagenase-like PrtC family protease
MNNKELKETNSEKNKRKLKFSIGYNQDNEFIDKVLIPFKEKIEEVYFPINAKIASSGRARPQKENYNEEIKNLIKTCNSLKISTNLILNGLCEGAYFSEKEHIDKIIEEIKTLKEQGLKAITIVNPIYLKIIKNTFPNLKIHNSVKCFINTEKKAEYYSKLGSDIITIDREINRNLNLIKSIKSKTGKEIKLLINEGCIPQCPFRIAHFNEMAHQKDSSFYTSSCINFTKENPETMLASPFIRPEDLHYYKEFVDYFKLGTRDFSTERIIKTLNAYISESYEGNLYEILLTSLIRSDYFYIDNKSINSSIDENNNLTYNKKLKILLVCAKFKEVKRISYKLPSYDSEM